MLESKTSIVLLRSVEFSEDWLGGIFGFFQLVDERIHLHLSKKLKLAIYLARTSLDVIDLFIDAYDRNFNRLYRLVYIFKLIGLFDSILYILAFFLAFLGNIIVHVCLQVFQLAVKFCIVAEPVSDIFDQSINLVWKTRCVLFEHFLNIFHFYILVLGILVEFAYRRLDFVHQLVSVGSVLFKLCNLLQDPRCGFESRIYLGRCLLGITRQFIDLSEIALHVQTHLIDLSLHIFGFIHRLFNYFGKGMALLLPQLVYEFASITKCIDVVLVDGGHYVISIGISCRELSSERCWN